VTGGAYGMDERRNLIVVNRKEKEIQKEKD
jgi:hypothetical protein